jgi:hypothetical protein
VALTAGRCTRGSCRRTSWSPDSRGSPVSRVSPGEKKSLTLKITNGTSK